MAIGPDRVQVVKQESTAEGGDDADAGVYGSPVPLDPQEDALESAGHYYQDAANRDELVYIERDGDDLRFRDKSNPTPKTLTDLLAGDGGLTPGAHRSEDVLVHLISENSYEEVTYTGNKVDTIIIWTDNGKTVKIREEIFTYSGNQISTIVTKQYDGTGTLVTGETMTETFTYSGGQVSSIDRVMS